MVAVAGGQLELVVTHVGTASAAPVVSCQLCMWGVVSKPFCSPLTNRSKKRTSWLMMRVDSMHIEW